jgi:pimeloyl-ACP methyl ester carboxylesterase
MRKEESMAHSIISLSLALALASPLRASVAQSDTIPPIPAPGRMVDLGGWRVHLNCTGTRAAGQPLVVLDAGAGGFSVDFSLVQPEVARFARVCSYDRAGMGWSELGPRPRTQRQIVWELHTLLAKAGETPPYVLVGHSWGGILARAFTFTYPREVVGLVLEESGHERGVQVFRDGKMVRLIETATGRPVPEPKTSGPLRLSDIPPNILAQIEASARQMQTQATRAGLPPDAQRMRVWAYGQARHWATNDNPFEGEELASLLARWTGAPYPLGDLPVVVLSRGRSGADSTVEREHTRNQAELLRLSRNSRQVMARRSGHEVSLDEPQLVVAAIRDVLADVRKLSPP